MVFIRVFSGNGGPLPAVLGSIVRLEPFGGDAGDGGVDSQCNRQSGQHAVSGTDGLLQFDDLEPDSRYTIHLEAKDHLDKTVLTVPKPTHRLLEVTLPPKPRPDDERNRIQGQVRLPDGSPAFDAHVVVRSMNSPNRGLHYDSEAATDKEGRFVLYGSGAWGQTTVSIEAEGCVPNQLFAVRAGAPVNTLQLIAGATIRGRVLRNAQGVAGVGVLLVPIPTVPTGRGLPLSVSGSALTNPRQTTTDADGRYTFEHVEPDREHELLVPMTAVLKENLFSHRQDIRSGADGQTSVVAELNLHPAHRLSGQIVLSDGRKAPARMVAVLERASTRDLQQVQLDAEGRFEFAAAPSEGVVLSFHTPGNPFVPGYRLSRKNHSSDPMGAALRGRIDEDRQLTVLLEPGPPQQYVAGETPHRQVAVGVAARRNAVANRAVVQRVVVQNGRRVVVQEVIQQPTAARDFDPLAGVSDEDLSRIGIPANHPKR